MSDFELPLPVEEPRKPLSIAAAMGTVAMPYLLFSGLLLALLLMSWEVLLPRFSRVEVSGRMWTVEEVGAHRKELAAQILRLEKEREEEALSVRDDDYQRLKTGRTDRVPLARLLEEVRSRAAAAAGTDAAIRVDSADYDIAGNALTVRGDVHDAGARSMTVLAGFVEALGKSPLIERVDAPRFTREEDPKTGPHSPFTLTLRLP